MAAEETDFKRKGTTFETGKWGGVGDTIGEMGTERCINRK
jgi:hypothetical protein